MFNHKTTPRGISHPRPTSALLAMSLAAVGVAMSPSAAHAAEPNEFTSGIVFTGDNSLALAENATDDGKPLGGGTLVEKKANIKSQIFRFSRNDNGTHRIISELSQNCLTADNGGPIWATGFKPCKAGDAMQDWSLKKVRDNVYTVSAAASLDLGVNGRRCLTNERQWNEDGVSAKPCFEDESGLAKTSWIINVPQ
ncbi:RICIN domain-containing protein [Streptomyces sp. NPDC048637]|uniref:RICIN domain-containing protein n=1 Tax=Streptomyces sp. NPDC048637 TaxID=3155636 RepID=UPI0034178E80